MLDPFVQLFQHCWGRARALRMAYKDLWVVSFPQCTAGPSIVGSCCIHLHTTANTRATTPNIVGAQCTAGPSIVGSCCIHLHTTANTRATTPNIVGATMLGVVASICTLPKGFFSDVAHDNGMLCGDHVLDYFLYSIIACHW